MLVYHPAFDLYNCLFRILQLLSFTKEVEIDLDKIRIWDFYLAFPREVFKISFPAELSELKKVFKEKEVNPYEDISDSKIIFDKMRSYQIAALKCLASYGLIESDLLSQNKIKRSSKEIPLQLKQQIENLSIEKNNVIKLILSPFYDLPLYGQSGLKARTGLIDYKYDPR